MPTTSAKQHRAMAAAAHGKSTLGIPKKVGMEMIAADRGSAKPKKKRKKSPVLSSHRY